MARPLEPRVLVGGVIDDQLGDDLQVAAMGLADETAEIAHRAVGRVDAAIVRDVVAVVAQRRWIERQQPDRRNAQLLQVVQPFDQTAEVADTVIVAVEERFDVELIDDCVFVPERIAGRRHGVTEPEGSGQTVWGRPSAY